MPAAVAEKPKRYIINVQMGNDQEPRDIFIGGAEEGDMLLTRGRDVEVPASVLERLDHAILGVSEVDPDDPTKTVVVERKRFPYSVVGVVQ